MKVSDQPVKLTDEVMDEVRAIKRAVSERHANNVDRLLESLITQERGSDVQETGGEAVRRRSSHSSS